LICGPAGCGKTLLAMEFLVRGITEFDEPGVFMAFEETREDLVANREQATRRLISFVGLDWSDACLAPESNRRVVKTASMWQARQPVYRSSVERWRRYEPWLGELRDLLPGSDAR